MSNYQDPNYRPAQRHRRSDRYRQTGDSGPSYTPAPPAQQQEEEERSIQWQRRQPSSWPDEELQGAASYSRRRSAPSQDDQMYMRRPVEMDDDYDDDEGPSFPWMRVIVGLLVAAVLFVVALHFIHDAGPLTPIKNAIDSLVTVKAREPGAALSFQAASASGAPNSRMLLSLTTNQAVDGVRIEDENGSDIACTVSLVNGANETNKIWNINAIFETPYIGEVYAVIKDGDNWVRTDKSVSLTILNPTPVPTETPLPTQVPLYTVPPVTATEAPAVATEAPAAAETPVSAETPAPTPAETASLAAVATWAPTNPPLPTEAPTQEPTQAPVPTQEPTLEPTQEPTPDPTAEPTEAPTPGPTAVPTATPLPRLEATAGSGSLKVVDTVYNGKKNITSSYTRAQSLIAPNPDEYTHYPTGVVTFRGDNFRRNAAFGITNVENESLSVLWKTPVGSLRTDEYGTLYGVGWTGQPAIIRWTREVRLGMNLFDDKKANIYLTEVIFGAQDGKIYFLDLSDGSPTRDPINVGYPLKGSVAIDNWDRPLLAVGQGISKLANGKSGTIGLHIYNLVNGKEAFFLNGRKRDDQLQYSTNGAFDGTGLFLFSNDGTDEFVVAGENGLLYTVDLHGEFIYPNNDRPTAAVSMEIKPNVTYLRTKAADEKDNLVNVESSVAMYDKYIYMADTYGVVRCVDSDTMKTVWAIDGGDNTDAAIALDMDGASGVSLYTGNTAYSRLGKKNDVTIRRLNALTGEEIWQYQIKCDYDKNQLSGCKASPIIGQNSISHLVIFTVNMVEGGGSKILALDKQTGRVVWEKALTDQAISSPVAVYNAAGEAWIIQGDEGGNLTLLNGQTGQVRSTLNLGGSIQGSPAVFRNYLVVGTCSKDNAYMYGIRIE